ncbi:MAG TPA: hypothetical protein VIJ64_05255 [Candidatus Lustribacter sp.]
MLARALAACACARAPIDLDDTLLANLTVAVGRLDDADRTYRAAIEAQLPAPKAAALLRAMAAFRTDVAALRERTRVTTGYGDFDPLDTYVPAIPASHAHAVRAANTADLARGEVAELRARANAAIGEALERNEIERLTEAKRARNAAFDRAIREAVPGGTSDQLATQLMLLADGWY